MLQTLPGFDRSIADAVVSGFDEDRLSDRRHAGRKELLGFQAGLRQGAQSWRERLVDIRGRGLNVTPELAVDDGGLGFCKAVDQGVGSGRKRGG